MAPVETLSPHHSHSNSQEDLCRRSLDFLHDKVRANPQTAFSLHADVSLPLYAAAYPWGMVPSSAPTWFSRFAAE